MCDTLSLAALKIFHVFNAVSLIMMSLDMDLFDFILVGPLSSS